MSSLKYPLVLTLAMVLVAISFIAKAFVHPVIASIDGAAQCADTTSGDKNPNKVKFISCGGFL